MAKFKCKYSKDAEFYADLKIVDKNAESCKLKATSKKSVEILSLKSSLLLIC